MRLPANRASLNRDNPLTLVTELHRQIDGLTATVDALRSELDRFKRGKKCQAAPGTLGTSSRPWCRTRWRFGTHTATVR
jgi:hypothetical protein